jgi:hypothetical protein
MNKNKNIRKLHLMASLGTVGVGFILYLLMINSYIEKSTLITIFFTCIALINLSAASISLYIEETVTRGPIIKLEENPKQFYTSLFTNLLFIISSICAIIWLT